MYDKHLLHMSMGQPASKGAQTNLTQMFPKSLGHGEFGDFGPQEALAEVLFNMGNLKIITPEEQYYKFRRKTRNMSNPNWDAIWHFLMTNNPSELDAALVPYTILDTEFPAYQGFSQYKIWNGEVVHLTSLWGERRQMYLFQVFYKFILPRKACMAVYLQKMPVESLKAQFRVQRRALLQYWNDEEQERVLRQLIKQEVYRRAYTNILLLRTKLPLELINIIHEFNKI